MTKKGTAGATTSYPAILGVYIDSRVNATVGQNGAITYAMKNSEGKDVSATYEAGKAPKLYVLTQGVQSEGFEKADVALTAGFGEVNVENALDLILFLVCSGRFFIFPK